MGYQLSKESFVTKDTSLKSKEQEEKISIEVSQFIAKKIATPPLKLKLIDIYHGLYERLCGPWGRVVGSYADSLSISTSDVDIVLDNMCVNSSPKNIMSNSCNMELVIFTEDNDIPPGCCWLRVYEKDAFTGKYLPSGSTSFPYFRGNGLTKRVTKATWNLVDIKGYKCLSCRDMNEQRAYGGLTLFPLINRFLPHWIPHGPAFKQTYFWIFDVDIVEAFRCKTLPSVLFKWAKRTRKAWPSPSTIEKALEQGCHVISLPSKVSLDEYTEVEFRLGYGPMEKLLTESLSDCQKQCYILLKVILKEYIEPRFPDQDILSSYVMKMLIFWMSEETDSDIWRPACLLECLQMCLEKLYDWVESGYCPNYFIPEYNLFRTKLARMQSNNFACWLRETVDFQWNVLLHCKTMEWLNLYV
ncbi:unnamed protein product [Mytilus coruscus]|uniref:Mab-21-like HhH/H2TH-like domain-containing protein n=1 Tax=Mytilus coruscus TaxID=42192 RepID=A0A6J8DCK7_MYTCO|nr:unnamed protein product [Mytilus coruscus]